MRVELNENNSGGSWWLNREQYDKLLANGWNLPVREEGEPSPLDSLSKRLSPDVPWEWRHGLWGDFDSLRAAVESFERLTGEDFFAAGCNCCGCPFSMSTRDGDKYDSISGDSVERLPVRPW